MRVFMTGGYGCIGSWVAKQLADRGDELWIYDLKEDTHRLDLVMEPALRSRVHFVAGDVADVESVRSAVERVGATHILHLAGLQTPTCRADPILGAKVNVIGTLAVFETAVALKHQVERVVYASSAAVHGPSEPGAGGAGRRSGPACAAIALWCIQGLQRAQRPGLLARPWRHQHRFASLDRLRSRPRFRDDQRADQGDQVGRAWASLPDQLRRAARPSVRRRRGGDVRSRSRPALRRGRGVQPSGRRRADRGVCRALCVRSCQRPSGLVTHGDRQLPIAADLDDTRLQACLGPIERDAARATGSLKPIADSSSSVSRAGLTRPICERDRARIEALVRYRTASGARERRGSVRRVNSWGSRGRPSRPWLSQARGLVVDGAAGACGREEVLGHRLDVDLGCFPLGGDDGFLKVVTVFLQDVQLGLLEIGNPAFLAVGDLDQVVAERRFDRVGNHPLLQFEGDVGELRNESGAEREVIEVAAGAPFIGRVFGILVGRGREGESSVFDLFLDVQPTSASPSPCRPRWRWARP